MLRRKIPTLLELCIQTAIDNIRYLGDVGDMDIDLLKDILPHCTVDQLMHIENSSTERDLSPVTDKLWKAFYEHKFGKESTNEVIERMKKKRVSFKWMQLYEAKLRVWDEEQKKSVVRLKQLYEEETSRKQKRQIQLCTKVPPSSKRSWGGSSGSCNNFSSSKGSLMKKARMEFRNSPEVKMHAITRLNRINNSQKSQSIPRTMKPPCSMKPPHTMKPAGVFRGNTSSSSKPTNLLSFRGNTSSSRSTNL